MASFRKIKKSPHTESVQWIETPWRYWLKTDLAETQVEESLDHAAITYVLNMLHLRANHLGNAIDVLMTPQGNVTKVVAAETLGEETLSLLPCVPHSLKFLFGERSPMSSAHNREEEMATSRSPKKP